jgi:phosphoribosylanthranilate isomerase
MSVAVKICGLCDPAAVAAAVAGGAAYVGFVFFPPSPRAVTPQQAAELAAAVPVGIARVGLFVDADDAAIAAVLAAVPLDYLQCHGHETPERLAQLRTRFGRPLIKAIAVAGPDDLDGAAAYEDAAARLLFDARPPAAATRPGGNARTFDWSILQGRRFQRPWLLAGGLTADNVADAVRISGADAVDVSSGVETAPGVKDPALIRQFLETCKRL